MWYISFITVFWRKNRLYSKGKKTFSLKLDNYKQSIKSQYFFYFQSTFQGIISKKRLWNFAIIYLSSSCIKSFAFSFSYAIFCLLFSFIYSWVSLCQSFMMFYYSKSLRVHASETLVPTACISGDCNQTWPGSGTSGRAEFGIFKRLWQTRGFENKVQLWPMLSCVIRRLSCPQNSVIKIYAYLHRWSGNFLASFWILFH